MKLLFIAVLLFSFACTLSAKDFHHERYVCKNGWLIKVGDTLNFGASRGDSVRNLYTKFPWGKGKTHPYELPKAYGNRKMVITDIERSCFKTMCMLGVHLKSDTLEDAIFYIEDELHLKIGESGLVIPKFIAYNTCPVRIDNISVSRNSIGSPVVHIRFTNVSNEEITGIRFSGSTYNSVGEVVKYGGSKEPEILYSGHVNPMQKGEVESTLYLFKEGTNFGFIVYKVQWQSFFTQPWEWRDHAGEMDIPKED